MFIDLLDVLGMIGTVSFAVSGALTALHRRFDLFGTLFLAAITAIGGGVIRDILLGLTPPAAFTAPLGLVLSLGTALATFVVSGRYMKKHELLVVYSDALGLGVFTATGAARAYLVPDCNFFLVLMTGMFTGIGGGMLRDILAQRTPFVLQKEVYATASLAGALAFYLARHRLDFTAASYICFFVTTGIRIAAIRYKLNVPHSKAPRP